MTANVDRIKYGMLLMQILPSVITNDEELKQMNEEVDRLLSRE